MTKTKGKYRSEIAGVVQDGVRGMHKLGLVDKKTMREFDLRCLTTVEKMTAKDILALREREGVSQAVFARCLNVTTNYISQLERGAKRPRGATLKLLSLIKSKGLEAVL
jgi:putative transcriptional regulator